MATLPLSERSLIMIIASFFVILVSAALAYYLMHRAPALDEAMLAALANVETVESYIQDVETEIDISGRHLKVEGVYVVNRKDRRYSSVATTTLTMPDDFEFGKTHEFTLENVSVADDVFTRIRTSSEYLKKTIPHSESWRRFSAFSIPPDFENIAIPGPTLDNLKLLSENGMYLTFIGQEPDEDGEKYSFRLSGLRPPEPGTLNALIERIGPEGSVTVWLDESGAIRTMLFENETYRSRTHISDINNAPKIQPPVGIVGDTLK